MGQQQEQQPPQHLNPVVDPAKVMGATAAPPALIHCNSYSLDDASTCLVKKQASARLLLNPWRELTPSDFVIGYARGVGRVRCSTCLSKITQGELQLGAFYMHDQRSVTLLRWHHQRCIDAPDCLTNPFDLCGTEDLTAEDLEAVCKWLGYGIDDIAVKDRTWTA